MICVDAERVTVTRPDKVLFAGLSVTISRGDRVAVVGVNGSGKTTLLRVLTGDLEPDDGVVRFGRGVRIARLDQDPVLPTGTVSDFLGDSWEVAAVATSLGVQPLFGRPTDELSGGQAKRVALAKVLVGEHDLIVVDEPTNHLDLEAIEWLEDRLLGTSAALVLVTHDRHVLDRLTTARGAGAVVEIDRGVGYVHTAAEGSSAYATYLEARAERAERDAAAESTRRILARKELAWLRRGAPARSTKPKARLRSAAEIVTGGPGPADLRDRDLQLGVGTTRLGNQVVELEGVAQRFDAPGGGAVTVLTDVDLLIEPGARLGVVGPNGSGKSTLLDIVAGRAEPVAGEVRRGRTVVTGYADQRTTTIETHGLGADATVRQIVAGPHRLPDHTDDALLERFWFDATARHAPVSMLSGGERRRLQLVLVLAAKPNLLVLDEPTNDLDLDTLRSLEDFLDDWPGALVVASHDRVFLDRTVDHVLEIDDGGTVRRVPGGVAGWLESRRTGSSGAPSSASSRSPRSSPSATPRPRRASRPSGPSPSTIGRRLRETEQAMARAERRRDRLAEELASLTDHAELARVGAELAAAQAELDALEERWLELADTP